MKIIKTSNGIEFEEFVALTRNDMAHNLSEAHANGLDFLNIDAYAITEDVNSSGEVTRVLNVRSGNEFFVTVSRPFVTEFINLLDMCESFGRTLAAVRVLDGLTQAGQTFISCKIAETREG